MTRSSAFMMLQCRSAYGYYTTVASPICQCWSNRAINNGSEDAYTTPYLKAYQNKQVLSSGVANDYDGSLSIQELAPGGEFDGSTTYEINDMSPIVIKLEDLAGSSNEFELTFNLE